MGWQGVANAPPEQQNTLFLPPLESFIAIFYCCLVFVVAMERYPKILTEIYLGLCSIHEN